MTTLRLETLISPPEPNEDESLTVSELYEVSAYNVGDINQCWGDPCIGAFGDNVCDLVAQGVGVCANNYYPKGTKMYIEGYGECTVLDRMNSRYGKYHIDIAYSFEEKQRALEWGRRQIIVHFK